MSFWRYRSCRRIKSTRSLAVGHLQVVNGTRFLQDFADTQQLLSGNNVNLDALQAYAREAADFSTNHQLPSLDFAINHYGQPDVAMFDFSSMYASENAAMVRQRHGRQLLVMLVGDSLLEVRQEQLEEVLKTRTRFLRADESKSEMFVVCCLFCLTSAFLADGHRRSSWFSGRSGFVLDDKELVSGQRSPGCLG